MCTANALMTRPRMFYDARTSSIAFTVFLSSLYFFSYFESSSCAATPAGSDCFAEARIRPMGAEGPGAAEADGAGDGW
jgi:hypothetical protein